MYLVSLLFLWYPLSLAGGREQVVIEDVLVELARQVYIEIKGAVIARAWKLSQRRSQNKNRKVIAA